MSDDATTPQASTAAVDAPVTADTPVTADAPVADAPVTRRCPWCSAALPDDATERCPQCRAHLITEGDTRLPGLTEVEAPLASKARRLESPRRSKLLSWISGDLDDEPASPLGRTSAAEALAPPPRDVRREMLRLQLEAEGITVAPDGSIELPADPSVPVVPAPAAEDAPSAASAPAPAADDAPDVTADDMEIRKAS